MTTKLNPLPGLGGEIEPGHWSVWQARQATTGSFVASPWAWNDAISRIIDACRRSQVCEWTFDGNVYWAHCPNDGGDRVHRYKQVWCEHCGWPVRVKGESK